MCLDDLSRHVDMGYLVCFLKAYDFRKVIGGTSQPQITKAGISSIEVPIYPKTDQLAIRTRLESILNKMAACERLEEKLDSFVKSRFVEMFGDQKNNNVRRLKDVCYIITDGTHQPPKFKNEGIPFLFVSNIATNEVTYETSKYISEDDYRVLTKRTPIEIGDILVSAVGSFGHPAIVKDDRPFCFQRHIAYLKPMRHIVNSRYLHAALLSEGAQNYMEQCAKGVAQRTVTLKSFKEMFVPVPPLSLQREFAAFAAQVDKSEFVARRQGILLDVLARAITA